MLAKNLKQFRKEKKLTQEAVSKKIGVAKNTYSGYERNIRTPDSSIQYKLADLFDVTLDELHGRNNKDRTDLPEDAEVLMFSDKDGWDELSEDRKKEIMRELSDLADFYIEKDKKARGNQ